LTKKVEGKRKYNMKERMDEADEGRENEIM
jgi:hypothetical protein